jgi:Fe-S-cluster containining protein
MGPRALAVDDCQRCGACCVNPSENRAEGVTAYVMVEPGDGIWGRRDLVKKLVVLDEEGVPHLRLTRDGRCAALEGSVGRRAHCKIYHHRPSPCRRVEPGSALCLRYRADQGVTEDGAGSSRTRASR